MKKKWWLIGGGAVVLVAAGVGAALVLGGASEPGDGPTIQDPDSATPEITTSASPAGPTLEPPVDGAIPVPAYPASAIPWDEVGPGWFLLSYDSDLATPILLDSGRYKYPPLDAAVMLVAPTGDLYYARSLEGSGSGLPWAWLGRDIFVLDGSAQSDSDEVPFGPLSSINLETGAMTVVNSSVSMSDSIVRVLPDGRFAVEGENWEGGEWVGLMGSDFTPVAGGCGSWFGAVTGLAPDGARVVCLEEDVVEDSFKSAVMLYNLVDGSSARIDTFVYSPESYQTYGWWDANSFVLTREDDAGTTLWWAYDVSTKKLRDLNAALSNGTPAERAQGVGGYRVVSAGATVEVQDFNGALLATVPCEPEYVSGGFALTMCGDRQGPMSISVANLDSGEVITVASYDSGANAWLWIYSLPDGA